MSFPRYPKYKDSGAEWLGQVPEHWEVKRLSPLSTKITNGFVGPTRDILADDGVRYLQSLHIKENAIRFDEPYYVSEQWSNQHSKSILETGDVLIVQTGDIGQATVVTEEFAGCNCHALIIVAPIRSVIGGEWISWVLNSNYGSHSLLSIQTGALHPHLNCGDVKDVSIPVPPLPEQTSIAAFLNQETAKIDELVAEQERLRELLKEKRQAVISHAVTKGLNPKAPMKPSGIEWLGDVPRTWAVIKLGRAVFMQEGPGLRTWQFTDEGTRVICVTNITEAGIDFTRLEKFISTEEYNTGYRHFTVQRGDVLLSSSGNSWGKVAIYEGEEEVILNTSTMRLNESEAAPLDRDYIAMLLQSVTVREQLGLAMTGSCQPNFGPTHLNCVMVAIPSRDEQAAIVTFLNTAIAQLDTLTAEAQRAIDLLQERRTALISAAVTGQIDVRRT